MTDKRLIDTCSASSMENAQQIDADFAAKTTLAPGRVPWNVNRRNKCPM
jgi:hypothetical protein